jgi:hypothetical protein
VRPVKVHVAHVCSMCGNAACMPCASGWYPAVPRSGFSHTMRPVQPSQLNINGTQRDPPQRIWVTRADHSIVILDSPRLSGDTLTGISYGEPQSIPLSQATLLRMKAAAPVKVVVLATVTGAVVFETLWYLEHRPDVGNAQYCGNALSTGTQPPMPFTPCCFSDSIPC